MFNLPLSLLLNFMPSLSPPGALLALGDPSHRDNDDPTPWPWGWAAWQLRTGFESAPYSPLSVDDTPDSWATKESSDAVKAFVSHFWALSDAERLQASVQKRKDNNSVGRNLWFEFFKASWKRWKMNDVIHDALRDRGMDPYSIMKRMKVSEVRQPPPLSPAPSPMSAHPPPTLRFSAPRHCVFAGPPRIQPHRHPAVRQRRIH